MTQNKPKIVAMIPARMGSSRFPGKPLARLLGRPMIEHVYHRTAMCPDLDQTIIATCDEEIRQASEAFGAPVIMTSDTHQRASDRIAEAMEKVDADIVVLVQGDEPMTLPEMVGIAVQPMIQDPGIGCVNLAKRITDERTFKDPNTIKVVCDLNFDALYFSRSPIPGPHVMDFSQLEIYKQVCIIPFTRQAIFLYRDLEPTPLERMESVDMMRFLEHGHKVRMVPSEYDTRAVDNRDDLARVEEMMKNDPLVKKYLV